MGLFRGGLVDFPSEEIPLKEKQLGVVREDAGEDFPSKDVPEREMIERSLGEFLSRNSKNQNVFIHFLPCHPPRHRLFFFPFRGILREEIFIKTFALP